MNPKSASPVVPLLAALLYDGPLAVDCVLANLAKDLATRGVTLAGVVQINETYDPLCPCDMTLADLGTGKTFRISQRLGRHARGCRLDPQALADAVALVESNIDAAQMLILNKFGKSETLGGGFRPVIAEALAGGKPVLVGLSVANRADFEAFAGEWGAVLDDQAALETWLLSCGAKRADAA